MRFFTTKAGASLHRFFLPVTAIAFLISSCQKDLENPTGTSEDTAVWVLKTKKIQGFATSIGHVAYTTNATFYYDTAAKTLTYRDTGDNQHTSEYKYFYTSKGALIRAISAHDGAVYQQADISYNSDSLINKITYATQGVSHEGTFQWSRQGTDYFGQYTDPSITSTPFSEGKRTLTLNSKKQLVKEVYLATTSGVPDQIEEVQRDASGSVVLSKLSFALGNVQVLQDSVIYTRDNTSPSRLSEFHSLWGKGIEWYSNGYFISFLVPPVWETEYHTYSNSLTKKKEHFTADIDANGNIIMIPYYTEEFVFEYDANKNPVKLITYIEGEKSHEVIFTWQKISWLK